MLATTPAGPATNVEAFRDETGRAGRVTGRAGFFHGPGRRPVARAVLTSAAPSAPPDPFTLATLPVGRRLLAATTADDFDSAITDLARAWTAAGFGYASLSSDGPCAPDPVGAPPRDGAPVGTDGDDENGGTRDRYRTAARRAWYDYAFDGDRVLCFLPRAHHPTIHGGVWNTISLAEAIPPRVELTPAGRAYGESYPETAALDVPALAVWLMSELRNLARGNHSALWPHVRYGAIVNPTRGEIRLCLYGLDDEPAESGRDPGDDLRAVAEVNAVVEAHNWTNETVPGDVRFGYDYEVVSRHKLPEYRTRGRAPGTVTLVTDDRPFWR